MPDDFAYDVFLSHSAKDNELVRPLAERLRADGVKVWFDESVLKPGDHWPSKIEEALEHSRVLVLCMSANASDSDWAQFESGTFRSRDPLNKDGRFLSLRLDDSPIKGPLAQFLYINWLPADREQQYPKLLAACRPAADARASSVVTAQPQELRAIAANLITQKDPLPSEHVTLQIDPFALCARLKSIPALREEELKRDFRGSWVHWWAKLSSLSQHPSDADLRCLLLCAEGSEGLPITIECSVLLAEYPVLAVARQGERLRLKGQIDDFSQLKVRLANATIEFPAQHNSKL